MKPNNEFAFKLKFTLPAFMLLWPSDESFFCMYFEFLLEQGVQLAESSLRMCTDHEEITPESLLASKKKNERT